MLIHFMKSLKYFSLFLLPLILLMCLAHINWVNFSINVLFAVAVTVAVVSLNSQSKLQQIIKFVVLLIYLAVLFFTFIETAIYNFAGHGFNNEVYFHVSFESFRIGLAQYGWYLLALILIMALIVGSIFYITRHFKESKHWLVLMSVVTLVVLSWYTPMGRFITGYMAYQNQSTAVVDFDDMVIENLKKRGFVNQAQVPVKQLITAETDHKTNLIFIFLESFNQFFLDTEPHNKLTPGMQKMAQDYQSFGLENSAYVTIEGLVSSMCGTLLTMRSGNDSFMPGSGYLENLPCLSDVLNKAGYEQYFLGGATMEFAGKGHFLKTHGYDHVWGLEHWQSQGKKSSKNFWGTGDSDLFDEALKIIRQAQSATKPYHLSLLTLGTHIPGFIYPGCESIDTGDAFTDAVNCTDVLLTRFIRQLEQENLLENTLFVVVADHGIFPNPTMKKIFEDNVYDRRLVGITNYSRPIDHQPLASYDLAPSILDWLNINHNALFLYGVSSENPEQGEHKHITRYSDWLNGQLVNNHHEDCGIQPDSKILNKCEKENLLNWTQWIQSKYSKELNQPEVDCDLNLVVKLNDQEKIISLNGENFYDQFHSNGFFLKTRQVTEGYFLFDIDNDNFIEKLSYLKLDDVNAKYIQDEIKNDNSNHSLILKVTNEHNLINVNFKQGPIWHESTMEAGSIKNMNICSE